MTYHNKYLLLKWLFISIKFIILSKVKIMKFFYLIYVSQTLVKLKERFSVAKNYRLIFSIIILTFALILTGRGQNWAAEKDNPFGWKTIHDVVYGDGKFVAVGDNGSIAYSTDGRKWTVKEQFNPIDIAYGDAKFVGIGNNGKIAYSTDGIKWTIVNDSIFIVDDSRKNYYEKIDKNMSISYGDGKFVAIGNNKIAYSTDGIKWTVINYFIFGVQGYKNGIAYGYEFNIGDIAYGDGKFVAVADNGKIAYSTDGIKWTTVDDSIFTIVDGNSEYDYHREEKSKSMSITYSGDKFIAVWNRYYYNKYNEDEEWTIQIAYSTDGREWIKINDHFDVKKSSYYGDSSDNYRIKAIAYGNTKFVAVVNSRYSSDNGKIAYSIDGRDWTIVDDSRKSIKKIAYDDDKFVAGYYKNDNQDGIWTFQIAYSTDGINWTDDRNFNYNSSIKKMVYSDNKFVAVGNYDYIAYLYSTNGIDWTTVARLDKFNTIVYGDGKFVAIRNNNQIAYSTDGIDWTIGNDRILFDKYRKYKSKSIAYGDGKFVAVVTSGYDRDRDGDKIAYSTDGIKWTIVDDSILFDKYGEVSIAYGDGKFVAAAHNANMACSTDAIKWVKVNDSIFNGWSIDHIIYGSVKFIAVWNKKTYGGLTTQIAYSMDGIKWTALKNSILNDKHISRIAYGDGKFVAVTHAYEKSDSYKKCQYQLAYSTDGIKWTEDSKVQKNTSNGEDIPKVTLGKLIGTIGGFDGADVIVNGKDTIGRQAPMGQTLIVDANGQYIYLESTFPMQTVVKCKITSGDRTYIKKGMKVYLKP